jgi:imidazole glycerol-phosphate synthase subunit HisH
MITIIDYGLGNLGSVKNMFKKAGHQSIITSSKEVVRRGEKLLLPGVGSFDTAMKNLRQLELVDILQHKVVVEGTPIMGICLGMQLLTKGSEEGLEEGLGFVDARAIKFNFDATTEQLPVPHMGWNEATLRKESKLMSDPETGRNRYYFVHSYAVQCTDSSDVLTQSTYGYKFVSSFEKNNIIGCQFHPEKSHNFGLKLFRNFAESY